MKVTIQGREIGPGKPTYIIAEMSGNHKGDLQKALAIVGQAKAAGADAIKLQTYRADTITLDSQKPDFLIPENDPWHYKGNLFALYEEAFTPWEWHAALFEEAKRVGIAIFSSPFDLTAVDFLETLGCPAYKIASPEITDIPLLRRVAQTRKPVIMSTGLAELPDIALAVETLKQNGCTEYILLKCTASYPAPPERMNLLTIPDMIRRFGCLAGLSDHTLGIGVPVASVALGATVIEKHFMSDKDDQTVDSFFSLDPVTFKQMVDEVRKVELALGGVVYDVFGDPGTKFKARRSLYISTPIKAGEPLTASHVKSVRPSWGLHPKHYDAVLGRVVNRDLDKGDRLNLEDLT
ncbi:MAG: pseudaminic acid synthase [Candidatus Margulisiibacteriota bacterium]